MKKKLLSSLLIGAVALSLLAGCGAAESTVTSTSETASSNTETEEKAEEKAEGQSTTDNAEQEAPEVSTDVLKIGFQPKFGDPIIALEEQNHYIEDALAQLGVKVEYYEFQGGPAVLEALSAGMIDVANTLGDVPVITSAAAGNPVEVVLAGATEATKNHSAIVVDKESGITKGAELKGKRIAVNLGTAGHLFILELLNHEGISVDDVELIKLSDSDFAAAFESDSIDAAVTSGSMAATIQSQGAGEVLEVDYIKLGKPVFVANKEFASKNSDVVAAYVGGVIKDLEYFSGNISEVQQLTATRFDVPVDSLSVYTDYGFDYELNDEFKKYFQQTVDFLVSQEVIEGLDIEPVINDSYIKKALSAE